MNLGKFINQYIKSYGTHWFSWKAIMFWHKCPFLHDFWPRRWLVNFICRIIAQIDEEEYQKCKNKV